MTSSFDSTAAANEGGWRRILARIGVDLRPGEGQLATLLFLYNAFLFAGFYASKAVRQATYIDSLGSTQLPLAYLLVALGSYPAVRLYTHYADRLSRDRLLIISSLLTAGSMVGFWWLFQFGKPWIAVAFYLWIALAFGVSIAQFWSYAHQAFDPRQAKRLFGFLGAGASVGGIVGGQLTRLAAENSSTRDVLLIVAACLLAIVGVVLGLRRRQTAVRTSTPPAASAVPREGSRDGLKVISGSPVLRQIALVVVIGVVVSQIIDLQFNWAVEGATTDLSHRTRLFGHFYSLMGVGALIFQVLFTSRIQRSLGVGFAMRVLPLTVGVGSLVFIGAGMLFPAFLLAAAWALKIGEGGLRHSFDQTTRELLYLPLPPAIRVKAKAYIDVFVQRFAEGIAAILLLTVTFGLLDPLQAGLVSLVLIALWVALTARVQRSYVKAYRKSLETGVLGADSTLDIADATTIELLVESLGATEGRRVLHSIDLLAFHGRSRLVPPLLLHHDDPKVRRRTLQILADIGRRDAIGLIERSLSDSDPEVRSEAIRSLAMLLDRDAAELMVPRLGHPDPAVRASAVVCLADHFDESTQESASQTLAGMLSDADPAIRRIAAQILGEIADPIYSQQLVRTLFDDDTHVVRDAIAAVARRMERDGHNPIYVPILIALTRNRRWKHDCREALVACGEAVIPALAHFMGDTQEQVWVRRAVPKTIARIGGPAAIDALVRGISSTDAFLRHKLLEALVGLKGSQQAAIDRGIIEREIEAEATRYLQNLVDLIAVAQGFRYRLRGPVVTWDDRRPSLLLQLLAEGMIEGVENLFRLLALVYPRQDMLVAYRGLVSHDSAMRSNALEYLDNTLDGEVHRLVFTMVDDTPVSERRRQAERTLQIPQLSVDATLRRLIEISLAPDGDGRGAVSAAALYTVFERQMKTLYPLAREVATSGVDPFAKETAGWIIARMDTGTRSQSENRERKAK